jgi:hypothetical protein
MTLPRLVGWSQLVHVQIRCAEGDVPEPRTFIEFTDFPWKEDFEGIEGVGRSLHGFCLHML